MQNVNIDKSYELLKKYNKEDFHIQHGLTVGAVMRWYANELGHAQDADYWYVVGLLHDIDFELYPEEHCEHAPTMLKDAGYDEEFIHSVLAHAYGTRTDVVPEHEMEKVLFAVDELTGLIWSASLVRPSKSTKDMKLKSLKKKYKNLNFAAGCSRDNIEKGAEMLGWELDKLMQMTLDAMKAVEDEISEKLKFIVAMDF